MKDLKEPGRLKILVIGGCHPQGHPVGYEHGFPQQLQRNLAHALPGVEVQVITQVGWAFSDIARVGAEALQREKPDLFILQYGTTDALLRHKALYWLMKTRKKLYALAGRQAPEPKKLTSAEELSAAHEPGPWKAKELAIEVVRLLAWVTPGRYVRTPPDQFVSASLAMLKALEQSGDTPGFVLSTLRRYGYVQTRLYRQYAELIRQVVAQTPYRYVDVMTELYKYPHDRVMVDSQHLSIFGQKAIADTLARAILASLSA